MNNMLLMIANIGLVFSTLFLISYLLNYKTKKHLCTFSCEQQDNLSVMISNSGVYLAVLIGSMGTISQSLSEQLLSQLLLISFMFLSFIIIDKIVFKDINNMIEVLKNNLSLAITEFSIFVGTGIIAYASFTGNGPWYSSIAFFILGQILFIGTIYFYNNIIYKNILEHTQSKNISAGLLLGSTVIAIAIIFKSAIIGDFVSWSNDLQSTLIGITIGFTLYVLIADYLIDLVFLPKMKINELIEKDLIPLAIKISALRIGAAFLINATI